MTQERSSEQTTSGDVVRNKHHAAVVIEAMKLERFKVICTTVVKLCKFCFFSWVAWLIYHCIVVAGGGEISKVIQAISSTITALSIDRIVAYIVALLFAVAFYVEKHRNGGLVSKKGENRLQVEGNDPNRSSSGLTPRGEDPR